MPLPDPIPDTVTLTQFSDFLSSGNISAVLALLLIIIIALAWDRIRLVKRNDHNQDAILENKEKELDSIKAIIEKYHEGNLNLSRTLGEIKIVLENIQRK